MSNNIQISNKFSENKNINIEVRKGSNLVGTIEPGDGSDFLLPTVSDSATVPDSVTDNDNDNCLFVSAVPFARAGADLEPADLNAGFTIGIAKKFHYEFNPGGKENIGVHHLNGKTVLEIPPEGPKWELKLTACEEVSPGTAEAADSTQLGPENTVTVEENEEGIPPKKMLLERLKAVMEDAVPLGQFLEGIKDEKLCAQDREDIIEQALNLVDGVYVHLPLKRAMYAIDPAQRLKLLKYRSLKEDKDGDLIMSDRKFHNEMISIFTGLRDLHTLYILPRYYSGSVAFLPFLIEEFYKKDGDRNPIERKYMVSKVFAADLVEEVSFKPGVTVTHWNGTPIEKAVLLNGERNAGGNGSARRARGVERMTIRPLRTSLPPEEEWVDITYLDEESSQPHNVRFPWYAAVYPKRGLKGAVESEKNKIKSALGVDVETEIVTRTKKELFFTPPDPDLFQSGAEQAAQTPGKVRDDLGLFDFEIKTETASGENKNFGYLRIYSFDVVDPDYFVEQFVDVIKPQLDVNEAKGLIIDVRGNGGGLIPAGERLLRVLTTRDVECERFQFINTPLTLELCQERGNSDYGLDRWVDSIDSSFETGALYSQGFPLETEEEARNSAANAAAKYDGPVILITDALSYSTTDIFAAGFKDNHIGKILGTHSKTGAGGANVWTQRTLRSLLGESRSLFKTLPEGCEITAAIRRAVRVGDKAGMPLEDLGVEADYVYRLTDDDLKNHNEGLIAEAARILDADST